MIFFEEIEISIVKFIWDFKVPQGAKTILEKKSKTGELTFPNFKTYYKSYSDQNRVTLAQRLTYSPM